MALHRDGAFVADDWIFPADDAPLPAEGKVAVGKARFLAERAALVGRDGDIGIVLATGENLVGLEADLARLALIVLRFPKFSDGRSYSLARSLRDTHGYRGELRASGDVLRDQIALLLRAGFDALDVTHAGTIAALRDERIVAVRRHYQPASAEETETRAAGPPWRRVSAAR